MKTLDQIIRNLHLSRRKKIAARAEQLIAEERALRHLRKARKLTQKRMAELLGIGRDSVSRLESRSEPVAVDPAQLRRGDGRLAQARRRVSRQRCRAVVGRRGRSRERGAGETEARGSEATALM